MTSTLVDSNVVLDVLDADQGWGEWSARKIAEAGDSGRVIINPIIFAEVSISFMYFAEFDLLISSINLAREPLPWEAAFEAGRAHQLYRRRSGMRDRTLPDFFIGAHAAVEGYRLLTRDPRCYRTYFPTVQLIAPDTHP